MFYILEDAITSAYRHNNREAAVHICKIMYEIKKNPDAPQTWKSDVDALKNKYANSWIQEHCFFEM